MKKALCVLLLVTAFTTGCSTSWLSVFDGYLKIAGPMLIQILDIVSIEKGVAPNAALVAKINADQAALNALAASVSVASSSTLPGTCQQFNTAVQTFGADLSQIEQIANIGASTSVKIQAIVGIAQAAIAEIETPIAACASSANPQMAREVMAKTTVTVHSANEVVEQFNAKVDSKHQVHLHSAPARWATAGILK